MRSAVTLCLALLLSVSAGAQVDLGDDAVSQAAIQIAEKLVAAAEPRSGEVVEEDWNDIQHPTIYVTLGSGDGVGDGTLLDIIEKGDPIKVGDEVIGFRENPAGTATITRVQSEKLSVARVETIVPNERPGKGSLAYVKTVPRNLAMCGFQNSDKSVSRLGREFADKVGAALTGTGKFTVIERAQVDELLTGLNATTADLLNPEKSLLLAPKVPARALVTGTIARQNDRYVVAVRVLEIGAGLPLGATTATMARSDEADGKYADAKGGTGGGGGTVAPPRGNAVKLFETLTPTNERTSIVGFLRVELGELEVGGKRFSNSMGYAGDFSASYDLSDKKYKELRAVVAQHPSDKVFQFVPHRPLDVWGGQIQTYEADVTVSSAITISTDGISRSFLGPSKGMGTPAAGGAGKAGEEIRIPLAGVRTLSLRIGSNNDKLQEGRGFVALEDFELVPAE